MRNPAALGRRDGNHAEIAKWYEDAYCSVIDLHALGLGIPDLLIGVGGRAFLREVKTEHGHLEDSQTAFAKTWRGGKIEVVRSLHDVTNDVLQLRQHVSRGRY